MPTYSYRCTECGDAFDIQQSFTDDSLTECPACRGKLRKLFSAVGVTFNGSGFYRTDSRAGASSGSPASSRGLHRSPPRMVRAGASMRWSTPPLRVPPTPTG